MNQFAMTPEGYEQAIEWLRVNGHTQYLDSDRAPMDAYSIITMANSLKNPPAVQTQAFLRPVLQAC